MGYNQIMLPDSNVDEPGSHGTIIYKIKPKANLTIPYQVNNTAYIYFDQNDAVQTNTAFNLYAYNPNGINEPQDDVITIYPNPVGGIMQLYFDPVNEPAVVNILNSLGEVIYSRQIAPMSKGQRIDLTNISNGLYFIKIEYRNKFISSKLVVAH